MKHNFVLFFALFACAVHGLRNHDHQSPYSPRAVVCPDRGTLFLREATSISSQEQKWLSKRHLVTQGNLRKFLKYNAKFEDSEIDKYLNYEQYGNYTNNTMGLSGLGPINIGLAFSGGGYRAMLCGAGELSALDNRTRGAFEHGLGGILESSSYLVGLSGGNWLVTTLSWNNWISVQEILDSDHILWDLRHSLYNIGGLLNITRTFEMWRAILHEVRAKLAAGFDITITDIWARSLSRQMFLSTIQYGLKSRWSSIRDYKLFATGQMPMPISVSVGRLEGTEITFDNSTVFESNPFELGTWDRSGYAFTDIKYLASNVTNGYPNDNDSCIEGFDNASFIMGTSSSLFNAVLQAFQDRASQTRNVISNWIGTLLAGISHREMDIANYEPSPFYQSEFGDAAAISSSKQLFLVDGGEDAQNVPLVPLLQKQRAVDLVIAYDNSADTLHSWPDYVSMQSTYERQFTKAGRGLAFPYFPDNKTALYYGLNKKPTFFGCDARNLTGLEYIPPLVIVVGNSHHSFASNVSTFRTSFETEERNGIIENGFAVASRNNLTDDSSWATCVGCAAIRRTQEKLGFQQSEACKKCFQEYCWDGKLYDGELDHANY